MHEKYLGDSYDIVKRFWAERLRAIGPLVAHPRFVSSALAARFERVTTIPVLDLACPPEHPFGLFLDPHTGIPLPSKPVSKPTASHVPLSFIEAEFRRLKPIYLVCFDQSHDRVPGLTPAHQRAQKRSALRAGRLHSFYYVSHAPFLFVASEPAVLGSVRTRLIDSGIPHGRFEGEDMNDAAG